MFWKMWEPEGGGQETRPQYSLCWQPLTSKAKLGQPVLNDHTGTSLPTQQPEKWTSTLCKDSGKYSLSFPQLPPLQLWYTVPKNVSTPNQRERHQSRRLWGGWRGGCSQWWQWRMARAQKLHCVSPRSPANAMRVCDWETGSQEPEQHLLSPWKSALSAPGSMRPLAWVQAENPPTNSATFLCAIRTAKLLQIALMPSKCHTD